MMQLAMVLFSLFASVPLLSETPSELKRAHVVHAIMDLSIHRDFHAAENKFKKALAIDENDYEANLDYAMALMTFSKPENPKAAVKFLKKALLKKRSAFNVRLLAFATLDSLGKEAAAPLFEESVRLALQGETADVEVTPPNLMLGLEQFQVMLNDRPEMKGYVRKDDWLWKWSVEKLGGVGLRTQVLWDSKDPEIMADAATYDGGDNMGRMLLRIRKEPLIRKGRNGNNYWASFVFEMLNNDWRERNTWMWMRAKGRSFNSDQLGLGKSIIDAQTVRKFHVFYYEKWVPHCKSRALPYGTLPWSMNEMSPSPPFLEDWVVNYLGGKGRIYDSEKK